MTAPLPTGPARVAAGGGGGDTCALSAALPPLCQAEFRAALLDPVRPVPGGLRDGAGRPAGRRFAVYRNNVAVSLTEALEQGFPATRALLGEDRFRAMAGAFLRAHPPASPVMTRYGDALPGFLDAAPQLARMRWLGDVARLEFALREAYHAADAVPVDPAALAGLDGTELDRLRLIPVPALRIVASDWPVLSIWRRARDPAAPMARPGAETVVVTRPGYDPEPHLLGPGDAAFLAALPGGTLAQAAAAAQAVAPGHDATPLLILLLRTRSLTRPEC